MIREFRKSDKENIEKSTKENIYQNVYFYIDSQTYGYDGENIKTVLIESAGIVKAVLYTYYTSLQIFVFDDLNDGEVKETADYILKNNFKMVSGQYDVIEKIHAVMLDMYHITKGFLMSGADCVSSYSGKTQWAEEKHCAEIAALICTDEEIGGHYTVDELADQLKDRMLNRGCRNLIITDNGKIISHMASYAEMDDIAVLGGLITHSDYRHDGLGKMVLMDLAKSYTDNNRLPVLFVYNENLVIWYEEKGWKIMSECGKMELINK